MRFFCVFHKSAIMRYRFFFTLLSHNVYCQHVLKEKSFPFSTEYRSAPTTMSVGDRPSKATRLKSSVPTIHYFMKFYIYRKPELESLAPVRSSETCERERFFYNSGNSHCHCSIPFLSSDSRCRTEFFTSRNKFEPGRETVLSVAFVRFRWRWR